MAADSTVDTRLLVALYLCEAAALSSALVVNRYYNLLGDLTSRQLAILLVPLAGCLVSGAYITRRFLRAAAADRRPLAFAVALNLVGITLVFAGGELVVRALMITTPAGESFAGTVLLPKNWGKVKARHLDILTRVPPDLSYFVADDLLGWAPGRSRRSTDGLYSSSAEGIRSTTAGMPYAAHGAKQRVAIVGDSFTFGLEVPFDDSWGAALQRSLGPDVAVLNFGVDGYGVDQAVLRYERDARPWKPAVAILGFIEHDLLRTLSVYSFVTFPDWGFPFAKPRFVLKDGALELVTGRLRSPASIFAEPSIGDLPFVGLDPGYNPEEWERHFYDTSYALRFLMSRFQRWPPKNADTPDGEREPLNTALVWRFLEVTSSEGTTPLVVYFPSRIDFAGEGGVHRDAVLVALSRAGVAYIDLRRCVEAVGVEKAFLPDRPHYSAGGNAAVAGCLLPAVRTALARH